MKTCPYCAEEIQDAAIVCRFCGRDLAPDSVALVSRGITKEASEPEQQKPSADATEGLALGELLMLSHSQPAKTKPNSLVAHYSQGPIETEPQSAPSEKAQPPQPSRSGSLILGSILIGVAFAALAAIPRVLDVFEIGEIAVSDPSAVPYLRGLEKDLAGHFITNLVIWSLIGGIFIWGWRRNRNVTIGILLVVGAIPIIWLGFSITQTSKAETIGAEQELANTVPATSLSSESQTIAPTPTLIRDQVPIFLRWEHPRNEYWWTNVEGALLEVTISSDRTLYQASWGQGNAGAQQAASDFFCSVTWVMYYEV